jgi:hypothetical protein
MLVKAEDPGMKQKKILLASVLFFAFVASENALSLFVHVQPIQVCADDGTNCANSIAGGSPADKQLFPAITDKIWAQANIDVVFAPWQTVNSSAMLNEDDFSDLGLNANNMIVNMWFLESLSECGGPANPLTLFGCGSSSGRVAITDLVFAFNANAGRLDTIAHELGHVLGLSHASALNVNSNLMQSGGSRTIPTTINDIIPDGAMLSALNAAQLQTVAGSGFVKTQQLIFVPEPSALSLFALSLFGLGLRKRTVTRV